MIKVKVGVATADLDTARTVHGLFAEVAMPAPDAVTLFEATAEATTHVVEAYYVDPPAPGAITDLLAGLDQTLGELLQLSARA